MKDLSLKELIELAKLAPQIEPKIEEQRGRKKSKSSYTSVAELISYLGLLTGKNQVPTKVLYDVYFTIAAEPMEFKRFTIEMSKHFKSQVYDNSYFKLNLKPQTILQRVHDKKDNQKEEE